MKKFFCFFLAVFISLPLFGCNFRTEQEKIESIIKMQKEAEETANNIIEQSDRIPVDGYFAVRESLEKSVEINLLEKQNIDFSSGAKYFRLEYEVRNKTSTAISIVKGADIFLDVTGKAFDFKICLFYGKEIPPYSSEKFTLFFENNDSQIDGLIEDVKFHDLKPEFIKHSFEITEIAFADGTVLNYG